MPNLDRALHDRMANAIRFLAADAVEAAKSGHPGMPMGMADAATVLFTRFLKFDAADPRWPDRDRFVLSAGHGSMLLYALLHLTGYADFPIDQLKNFRQLGARTAGHPEYGHGAGIETTTGPLGQGLANAVGMALAERHLAARFGAGLVDHYTYAIAGDGCLMEGISHEAASLAGHLGLARLIVLFDDNHISIDGPTDLAVSDDVLERFDAYGWDTSAADGHDHEAVAEAIARARTTDKPSLIALRTTIAFGAPKKAGTAATHGAPLGAEEIKGAREKLGWTAAPFDVPDDVLDAWRAAGARGAAERQSWARRHAAAGDRAAFDAALAGDLPATFDAALAAYANRISAEKPAWATRKASQEALEALTPVVPEMVGGSADLTGSNNTRSKVQGILDRDHYGGRYIHYGVREHAMAATMNGMALHGGIIPYGGTFLVFTDYCRPSIRLSALMGIRVIYVMTHDSIGLGEDGPTHQPVEHLMSLRAMPNLVVFRPADAVETAECWALALARKDGPSVLALTRQNVPAVRDGTWTVNRSAEGAYVLAEAEGGPRQVTLLATGSEVSIALEARALLARDGMAAAVVSMPSFELFDARPAREREAVLGAGTVRVAIEAGIAFGWERYLGLWGGFVGMTGFGASAPADDLYRHFCITPEAAAQKARALLAGK
ncbi:MAG: transketolase [Alphaproteobacteria bacterium]|nr:transketolase [Alphaproteobacteria bacterium]